MNRFKNIIESPNKVLMPIIILAVGLMIGGLGVYYIKKCPASFENDQEQLLSSQEAAGKATAFINQNLLQEGLTASLLNVAEGNGVYKFGIKVGEEEFDSYITKDGKILFASGIEMEKKIAGELSNTDVVDKVDTPDVKLFVMSYCPFGLQAEKALLPAWELLKGKAGIGIYFVDYIMHDKEEIDENLRQYCIQKEEPEKFISYLKCFVEDGDFEKCKKEVGVDEGKLAVCENAADKEFKITENYNDKSSWLNERYPKFLIHSDLNKQYGVAGSPALIINGKIVSVADRSPEAFKQAICQSFNEAPSACSENLSEEIVSSGFGLGTGSASGGSCE